MKPSYGSAWQEFRALLAVALMGLAQRVHFEAYMDFARELSKLERRP